MVFRAPFVVMVLLASHAQGARPKAEEAYQEARKAYYTLKGDASRRQLRHHWLNVAQRFEQVATRHPRSERAPDALFTAAELLSELSRISQRSEDLDRAVGDYRVLVENYARHRLADDGAFALAQIALERQNRPQEARRLLAAALKANAKSDQAPKMRQLLKQLPAESKAPVAEPKLAAVEPKPSSADPKQPVAKVESVGRKAILLSAMEKVAASPEVGVAPTAELVREEAPSDAPAQATQADRPEAAERVVVEVAPAPRASPAQNRAQAVKQLQQVAHDRAAELTLAEQLGLKVRRVVIDPGHGGHDTGAIGRRGTREKDVTLAIAKRLRAILTESGLEVMLTREDDTFVRLEDRAEIANRYKGDLFLSIHCNSAHSRKLRGIETYTLNTASDRYSIRLAARENSSTERSISDLQFILADLATKANTDESTRLATAVQGSMVKSLAVRYAGIKDLGTKEALFYVLLGAKMPAVLLETSFLSHAEEEQRLASKPYQEQLAQAIAQGVEEFLDRRARLARADGRRD